MVGAGVRLAVEDGGKLILEYYMPSASEAATMMEFLREFLPAARFFVEPTRH